MTDHSDAIVAVEPTDASKQPVLEVREPVQELRRSPGARRRQPERRKGQSGLHPGPERVRQVHVAALCELAGEAGSRLDLSVGSARRSSPWRGDPDVRQRIGRRSGRGSAWCSSTSISGRI